MPVRANWQYWAAGGIFMLLNKLRHDFQGYVTPRTFSIDDVNKAIEYDFSVVNSWRYYLNSYVGESVSLEERTVMELGPGADLGIGTILVALGVRKYCALDVHNLVENVEDKFYEALLERIEKNKISNISIDVLREQLSLTSSGKNDKINYVCDPEFNLGNFKEEGVDLVFSQAAFEHFDDIPKTFEQMTEVVKPGAVLLAEIDLSTHTRWLRDVDPLNIYRYSSWYYNLTKFRGSPNRMLPSEYKTILEDLGWRNVKIIPRRVLDNSYVGRVLPVLPGKFKCAHNDLVNHSVILAATR